jgi:hypothetical protein
MQLFDCLLPRRWDSWRRLSILGGVLLGLIAGSWMCDVAAQAAKSPQVSSQPAQTPNVPDWALPGSATHKQVPPPKDFHRPTNTFPGKIGIFEAQSDIGGPLAPGSASYDPSTGTYTVNSAGYNIWYTRDEFRYLWKKMSGDISFAANVGFPVAEKPPHDRKVVMVIRQDLDDDSKEIMAAEHGTGMVHLAQRPGKDEMMSDMEYRISSSAQGPVMPQRIGIEKRGDSVALWVSIQGEPMHQFGPPVEIHFKGPFYVGIGFCSHYPVTVDSGTFSDVVLTNAAGQMR